MPKASQKTSGSQKSGKKATQSQRSFSDDDDEDYEDTTQTQRITGAGKKQAATQFDPQEVESVTNDLVRYLLIADQKKQPIKRQDISRVVLKDMTRAFDHIMENAKTRLEEIFGIKVVDVDSKPKSYILVNRIRNSLDKPHLVSDPDTHAQRGLLILVLSVIFMNNNEIAEAELWHALAAMKLSPESNKQDKTPVQHIYWHELTAPGFFVRRTTEPFGDVKRLITTDWVRQGYLEYGRRPHTEPPEFDFRWGPRAEAELSKRDILDFVCEIHGDGIQAMDWKAQYQDAQRAEGAGSRQLNNLN